jgi:hypothetical protein
MNNQLGSPQVSYGDLERLGWPNSLIDDYQSIRDQFTPLRGAAADPNNIYRSNLSGMYIDLTLKVIWFNPTAGALIGWVAL